jgi:hypothetical protein
MVFLNDFSQILLTDYMNSNLRLFGLNGGIEKIIHVQGLSYPKAICIDSNKQMIISNADNLLIFNEKFRLLKKIMNENCEYIISDPQNPSFVYTSSNVKNKLKLFNMKNYEKIKEIEIDSPFHMVLKFNNLYVNSLTHLDFEDGNLKLLKKIQRGSNCIFVLNKISLQITKVIELENWLCPLSLFVDDNGTLITTAYKLNSKRELSLFRYLLLINFCGEVIHEIYLNDLDNFIDAILVENRFIFCGFDKNDIKYKSFWFKKIKME